MLEHLIRRMKTSEKNILISFQEIKKAKKKSNVRTIQIFQKS